MSLAGDKQVYISDLPKLQPILERQPTFQLRSYKDSIPVAQSFLSEVLVTYPAGDALQLFRNGRRRVEFQRLLITHSHHSLRKHIWHYLEPIIYTSSSLWSWMMPSILSVVRSLHGLLLSDDIISPWP
jgi:hypothetical protein